ncbi:hypothetical protein [Actinoplanes sp. HUAS TT8]|uniref:hypothetical protein n=1 Tax=Actinoplanes sp. HUAS TT8 TaxID=3447453 RepID=UPI003F528887
MRVTALVVTAMLGAAALGVTIAVLPGVHVDGLGAAFGAAWLGAGLMSVGLWVVTAGQDGVVTQHLLRINRRFRASVPRTDEPGLLIVQIDGLSAPPARGAVEAGNLPTLG